MWDDLVRGAIGAVVLVDTSRLADCFPAVDYMETQGVPFIVAVNLFHGKQQHSLDDVREALAVPEDVPDDHHRRPGPGRDQDGAARAGPARPRAGLGCRRLILTTV